MAVRIETIDLRDIERTVYYGTARYLKLIEAGTCCESAQFNPQFSNRCLFVVAVDPQQTCGESRSESSTIDHARRDRSAPTDNAAVNYQRPACGDVATIEHGGTCVLDEGAPKSKSASLHFNGAPIVEGIADGSGPRPGGFPDDTCVGERSRPASSRLGLDFPSDVYDA